MDGHTEATTLVLKATNFCPDHGWCDHEHFDIAQPGGYKYACDSLEDNILKAGCENFKSLHWDNPTVEYEKLSSCPP